MPLARAQVQTHLITVLLFPGVQRDLLHQLRQLQFADLGAQASRSMDSSASFADSSGVFSCSSAFFSAFLAWRPLPDRFNNGGRLSGMPLLSPGLLLERGRFAGRDCTRSVTEASDSARRCSPAALLQALPVHSFGLFAPCARCNWLRAASTELVASDSGTFCGGGDAG